METTEHEKDRHTKKNLDDQLLTHNNLRAEQTNSLKNDDTFKPTEDKHQWSTKGVSLQNQLYLNVEIIIQTSQLNKKPKR